MAMDDTCAVCADTLEWVAYGACGHKDVCSTCVVRLRLVCNDRRCCICKTESNFIFLTKALGDYTRTISDFSLFPSEPKEGRMGEFWYHEDTQAFFDDSDHYKMIKAMCRLSCSVCDSKLEVQPNDGPRRRPRLFRNIDQLKGHMFHQHKLVMCSLCLEGRKVFICEQKLYTRSQLNQHINTGDSEVDGSESERGGFAGHPKCEFCLKPFYGDNELYLHMSTEHYTCHICQRQHPGQYEYYKNYDDLELHFRRDHFLCEDEACLAKKFIVFPSETELKRHNTLEHAGHMSRSQRNAALQIPTSFRYRRNNERENRRGRGNVFQRDGSENDLSMAIQASFEAANLDGRVTDVSSSAQTTSNFQEELDFDDPLIPPYESEHTTNSDPPSRYLQALSLSARNGPIQEASFPPLPISSGNNQPRSYENALAKKKMAGQFRVRVMNKKAPVLALGRPSSSNAPAPSPLTVSPQHTWPTLSGASGTASGSGESKMSIESGPSLSGYSSLVNARSSFVHESTSSVSNSQSSTSVNAWPALSNSGGSASVSGPIKQSTENGSALSAYSASLKGKTAMHESSGSSFYSSSKSNTRKISHSASAPNLASDGSFNSSDSDFPPVSAAQLRKVPAVNSVIPVEDVHTANKSLVERIRTALNFDEDKYNDFKVISGEYRNGTIDAVSYLVSVEQFGLSHLLLEMARLLPDTEKQKELIDTYTANIVSDTPTESGRRGGAFPLKVGNSSTKGKKSSNNTSREILADNVLSTVRKLQSNYKPSDEEVEVLSKDGYRTAKGKSKVVVTDASFQGGSGKTGGGSNQNIRDNDVSNKQQYKKTSKFHRLRLGENSPAAILDLRSKPDEDPGIKDAAASNEQNPMEVLPARGVWRNGGGQKLLSRTGK